MRLAAALAIVLVLAGCQGGTARTDRRPPGAAPEPVPTTSLPARPSALPWLRSRLPRRVPSDAATLPRLRDDPPGRATMVYHPPEHWPEPVEGWASETLLFHGVDGRWRVLNLDELGLDDRSWPGHDTYGAGSLSPDGHRWAGRSRTGVVVVDLRTGRGSTIAMGSRWTAAVEWRDDTTLLVGHGLRSRTELVELSSRRRTVWPHRFWQASIDPHGGLVSVRLRDSTLQVARWRAGEPVVRGTVPVADVRVRRTGWQGPELEAGRMLVALADPRGGGLDLLVLDLDTLRIESRWGMGEDEQRGYVSSRWLDPRTVLLTTSRGLLAWRPENGAVRRVTAMVPRGNGIDGYASVAVAPRTSLPSG